MKTLLKPMIVALGLIAAAPVYAEPDKAIYYGLDLIEQTAARTSEAEIAKWSNRKDVNYSPLIVLDFFTQVLFSPLPEPVTGGSGIRG